MPKRVMIRIIEPRLPGNKEYEIGYTVQPGSNMARSRHAFCVSLEEVLRLIELGIDPNDREAVVKAPR